MVLARRSHELCLALQCLQLMQRLWLMQVAMEFDGPYHYTVNMQQPMGSTLLRRRTMRALGWTLISVPFYHWHSLVTIPDKVCSALAL